MRTKRWALATAAAIIPLAALNPAVAATATSVTCSAGTPTDLARCFTTIDRAATTTGTVRLTADVTMGNSTLNVDPGVWIRLDLAGHRLDVTGTNVPTQQSATDPVPTPAIGVPATATLTISDNVGGGRLDATGGSVVGDVFAIPSRPQYLPTDGTAAGIGTAGAAYDNDADADHQPPGPAASGTVIVTGGDVHATGGSMSSSADVIQIFPGTGAGIGTGGAMMVTGGPAGPVYVRGGQVTATGGSISANAPGDSHIPATVFGSTGAGIGSGGASWSSTSGGFGAISANPSTTGRPRLTAAPGSASAEDFKGAVGSALGAGGVTPGGHAGTSTGVKVAVFDTHGGSAIRPHDVTSRVTPPTAPVRTGWRFTGWYTSATRQQPSTSFDFAETIQSNVVIHAGWTRALP